jgi:hypothetical protein
VASTIIIRLRADTAAAIAGIRSLISGLAGTGGAANAANNAIRGMFGSLSSTALQTVGLNNLMSLGMGIVKTFDEASDRARELTREAIGMKNALNELMAIVGQKGGATSTDVIRNMEMARRVGVDPEWMRKYATSYAGAAELSVGNTIQREQNTRAMEKTARYSALIGADPEMMAELAGISTRFKNFMGPQGDEEVASQFYRTFQTAMAGRGQNAIVARELMQQIGVTLKEPGMKGAFRDLPEAMVAGGMFNEVSPGESATKIKSALRAMTNITGSQGDYLQGLGITGSESFFEALTEIEKDIAKNKPKEMDIKTYLAGEGFTDAEGRENIDILLTKRRAGMEKTLRTFAEQSEEASRKELNQSLETYTGTDQYQLQAAETANKLATMRIRMQDSPIEIARKKMEAELIEKGQMSEDQRMRWTSEMLSDQIMGTEGARKFKVDDAVLRKLRDDMMALGVKTVQFAGKQFDVEQIAGLSWKQSLTGKSSIPTEMALVTQTQRDDFMRSMFAQKEQAERARGILTPDDQEKSIAERLRESEKLRTFEGAERYAKERGVSDIVFGGKQYAVEDIFREDLGKTGLDLRGKKEKDAVAEVFDLVGKQADKLKAKLLTYPGDITKTPPPIGQAPKNSEGPTR